MKSKELFKRYNSLKRTDPEAAERFAREHMGNDLFAAGIQFQRVLAEEIGEQQEKQCEPKPVQQELFSDDRSKPKTCCGDDNGL